MKMQTLIDDPARSIHQCAAARLFMMISLVDPLVLLTAATAHMDANNDEHHHVYNRRQYVRARIQL